MDFVFQGFQSNFPVWLYALLIIGALALSWWSYKDIKAIHPVYKYGLITLRSTVFLILLVLLLNPFYMSERTYTVKPEIAVLLDNSASTSIQKGSYQGRASYEEVITNLAIRDSSQVSFRTYSLGNSVTPVDVDSLELDESETNLYRGIEAVRNLEDEIQGAILVSDGIFTQGRNPVFEAGNLKVPVMTVALGDTVQQKDLIVEEIVTNATGYVNTIHPVEVSILANGYSGESVEVQLQKGPEVLQRQTIQLEEVRSAHTLNFELDLQEEGLQQYEIVIPAAEGEWTDANNSQPFAIDVLNEKQRVLSLAFEVYPDVRFIRSELLRDENTSLIPRTWIGGDRFIEGDLNISPDTLELAILHGYPGSGLSSDMETKLQELLSGIPLVILRTPMANFEALTQREGITLPVSGPAANRATERVQLVPNVAPTEHPIMELPEVSLEQLPLISTSVGMQRQTASIGATTLFVSSFQGVNLEQPLITVQEVGNVRRTLVNGFGWYRIGQSNNDQIQRYVQQLFANVISWTATRPDNRRLKIQPAQKVFSGSEAIVLNAFLTNESGENEADATVEVTLSGDVIDTRFYSMDNLGGGRYRLTINSLPRGLYSFEATAQKGNRTIDTQGGEFSISSTNTEFVDTRRNDNLLRQISARTGGTYFLFSNLGSFADSLNKKGMLAREEKVNTTLFYPYQHSLWFIVVITLLAAEWILRKYLALT